jgi:hypothetical protein
MPTWGDLPRVVRLLILRTFCADLVPDLKALRQIVRCRVRWKLEGEAIAAARRTPKELSSAEEPALEWPPAPTSLTSFLSAVTTCREFADLILTEIKFDGRSTADLLLETQFANVKDMTDTVATGFFEPFGMLMSFGG